MFGRRYINFSIDGKMKIQIVMLILFILPILNGGESTYADDALSKKVIYKIALQSLLNRGDLKDQVSDKHPIFYDSNKVRFKDKKVDSQLYIADIFDLQTGETKFKNCWIVKFKPKMMSLSSGFLVVIEKSTSQILFTHGSPALEELQIPSIDEILRTSKFYIESAIIFHKAKNRWPSQIDEMNEYFDKSLSTNIANFNIEIKNINEIVLNDKNMSLSYLLRFYNNKYTVSLNRIGSFSKRSFKKMLDDISK